MAVRRVEWLRRVPGALSVARLLRARFASANADFAGSAAYWRGRYAAGGDSGTGSYGKFAQFKARVLNAHFAEQGITKAIEFGSGDGNQLKLLVIDDYLGVDISADAITACKRSFEHVPGRRFVLADEYRGEQAECALSLDVIYHLVEDAAFEAYMRQLFAAATRSVVIYSSDRDADKADGLHVRHRRFTAWVERHQPGWTLQRHLPNEYPFRGDYLSGTFADFYFYVPRAVSTPVTAGAVE